MFYFEYRKPADDVNPEFLGEKPVKRLILQTKTRWSQKDEVSPLTSFKLFQINSSDR